MTFYRFSPPSRPIAKDLFREYFFQYIQEKYAAEVTEPMLPAVADKEEGLWAQAGKKIVWGRIFDGGLKAGDLKVLRDDLDRLEGITGRKIDLCVFMSFLEAGVREILDVESIYAGRMGGRAGMERDVRYVQFYHVQHEAQSGFAFHEISFCRIYKKNPLPPVEIHKAAVQKSYSFFEEARLTEPELEDFLELGITIKEKSSVKLI